MTTSDNDPSRLPDQQQADEEHNDENDSCVGWATGRHVHHKLEDESKRVLGQEHFRLSRHPDGSRTMMVSKDGWERNIRSHIVQHVDASFRPLETYRSFWKDGSYHGSCHVVVTGDKLHASGMGPTTSSSSSRTDDANGGGGIGNHSVDQLPINFSVVTHSEALNGWAAWIGDYDGHEGETKTLQFYSIGSRDAPVKGLGSLSAEVSVTLVGEETVTTPAGTFETVHLKSNYMDLWVTKKDRILVRQEVSSLGFEYVLAELESGGRQD